MYVYIYIFNMYTLYILHKKYIFIYIYTSGSHFGSSAPLCSLRHIWLPQVLVACPRTLCLATHGCWTRRTSMEKPSPTEPLLDAWTACKTQRGLRTCRACPTGSEQTSPETILDAFMKSVDMAGFLQRTLATFGFLSHRASLASHQAWTGTSPSPLQLSCPRFSISTIVEQMKASDPGLDGVPTSYLEDLWNCPPKTQLRWSIQTFGRWRNHLRPLGWSAKIWSTTCWKCWHTIILLVGRIWRRFAQIPLVQSQKTLWPSRCCKATAIKQRFRCFPRQSRFEYYISCIQLQL